VGTGPRNLDTELITGQIIGGATDVQRHLGTGMLEHTCDVCLEAVHALKTVPVPVPECPRPEASRTSRAPKASSCPAEARHPAGMGHQRIGSRMAGRGNVLSWPAPCPHPIA
jgi:hypothetical protein